MQITTILWDPSNEEHIARHGVSPADVESACRSRPFILRGRQGYYVLYGRTAEGRYLFIVVRRLSGGAAQPVTARNMTETERRMYQRRH